MPRDLVTGYPGDKFGLRVGWNRDMDVQIGIETCGVGEDGEPVSLLTALYGDREPRMFSTEAEEGVSQLGHVGKMIREALDEAASDPQLENDEFLARTVLAAIDSTSLPYRGVWVDVSRRQINDMIQLLRRARGAAYGKDM